MPCEIRRLSGKKVIFVGDSITSDNLGYRATISFLPDIHAIDCSLSGATSSMLLHSAISRIMKEKPDLVSIMIGSNDSVSILKEGFNQVSVSEYERNLERIIDISKSVGAKVLLFEVPPVMEERFRQCFYPEGKLQSNENVSHYNEALDRIAERYGVTLLSNAWLSDKAEYYEPDGIHFSPMGQEIFLKKWLDSAKKII